MKRFHFREQIIKELLARHPMNRFNDNTQMSLFSATADKGANEWAHVRAVSGDTVGMFRVRQPEQQSRYSVTTLKRPARVQSLFFKRQTNQ